MLVACVLAAPAAAADESKLTYSLDVFGGYYAASPKVTLRTPEFFTIKSLKGVSFRPDHAVAYGGLGTDVRYFPGVPLVYVPAIGVRAAWPFNWSVDTPFGPNGEGHVELRDNINHLAYYLQLAGPGVGLEQAAGPMKLGGELRPILTYVNVAGTISQGELTTDVRGYGLSFSLAGDVHACYRVDHSNWGCLFVAPTLFESSGNRWWNGLHVGLRFEGGK